MHTIKIVVRRGVATVDHTTIPSGIAVEVDDQDTEGLDGGGDSVIATYTRDGLVQCKF
jgi:hypothetical protein